MCVNKVKGKKRVRSLVQLWILSLFPCDLLLVAHLLENEIVSGELNASICVNIFLSLEVYFALRLYLFSTSGVFLQK